MILRARRSEDFFTISGDGPDRNGYGLERNYLLADYFCFALQPFLIDPFSDGFISPHCLEGPFLAGLHFERIFKLFYEKVCLQEFLQSLQGNLGCAKPFLEGRSFGQSLRMAEHIRRSLKFRGRYFYSLSFGFPFGEFPFLYFLNRSLKLPRYPHEVENI